MSTETAPQSGVKPRFMRLIGGALTALLVVSGIAAGGAMQPAQAANGASLAIDKEVNGVDALTDVRPGETLTYRVDFQANDDDADGPVKIVDVLPAAFKGWQIEGLRARVSGSTAGLTLELPGVTSGPVPEAGASGQLSDNEDELVITVGVKLPVFPGSGNVDGLGLPVGAPGELVYTLTVPGNIGTDSPILRTDLVNTATISARAGLREISETDTATVQIDNPVMPEVNGVKSWTPAAQDYGVGKTSTITLSAKQTSNSGVDRLELRDPADPALTPEGAAELPDGNPFNFVDVTGFTPGTGLPADIVAATIKVYYYNSTTSTWNWVNWDENVHTDLSLIAGVHLVYEPDHADTIPVDTYVSQSIEVAQREKHRKSEDLLDAGWSITNTATAIVSVGDKVVTRTMEAPFEVIPEKVDVQAAKQFYLLPNGDPSNALGQVAAGDTIGAVLKATNRESPYSTELTSLKISEPAASATTSDFFSDKFKFAGFDNSKTIWPNDIDDPAVAATVTWWLEGEANPVSEPVTRSQGLPAPPAGKTVTGFSITFHGPIVPGRQALVHYKIKTSSTIPADEMKSPFTNKILVEGEGPAGNDSEEATATVSLVAPKIDLKIKKKIGPDTVLVGQNVYVQLETVATTGSASTKPMKIVVEDSWQGDPKDEADFWNAFELKQIIPPFPRPIGGGGTPVDFAIEYQKSDGSWSSISTADLSGPIDVPAGAIGVRFTYTHPDGMAQMTTVKPNLKFEARATLRSTGDPTVAENEEKASYRNTAKATGEAELDGQTVNNYDKPVVSTSTGTIIGKNNETGPVPGGDFDVWANKSWAHSNLTSQSQAHNMTTQGWAVMKNGLPVVTLQDSASGTPTGAGTVFEAFDLKKIYPIKFSGTASATDPWTVDPALKWDKVTAVKLFDGQTWHLVPEPAGGWMNAQGFVGYDLTAWASSEFEPLGVQLIIEENNDARAPFSDPSNEGYDPTVPAAGTGVALTANARQVKFDWQLRDVARGPALQPGELPKWVVNANAFNCGNGCIENEFSVTGSSSSRETVVAKAKVYVFGGSVNVDLTKNVLGLTSSSVPTGAITEMVLPNDGELASNDYPRAQYQLTGKNISDIPVEGAAPVDPLTAGYGAMSVAQMRISDSVGTNSGTDIAQSPFVGRVFADEAHAQSNVFDRLNITKVSFGTIPNYIDTTESQVEVWTYDKDATPVQETTLYSLQEVLDGSWTVDLSKVVGVSTIFSGTNPEMNGNRIPVGAELTMKLDVQLRDKTRVDDKKATAPDLNDTLRNVGQLLVWDAVNQNSTADSKFELTRDASIRLAPATVRVAAEKTIAVVHGTTRNTEIIETEPEAPVRVNLEARPNGSTAPIKTLRIEDSTPEFWEKFELKSVEALGLPRDADHYQVELLVGGTWVPYLQRPSGDYSDVRGIAVDFTRTSGNQLFPDGAASWSSSWLSASLPFTAQLRDGAEVDWTGDSVDNTVHVSAENPVQPAVTAEKTRTVNFGPGKHGLQVVKLAPNMSDSHFVEPLTSYSWKLEFTNTGTSYLPIDEVVDTLPITLDWDWMTPRYTSTPGPKGAGLTVDDSQISMMYSDVDRNLSFKWPAGQRMFPGEKMSIEIGLILDALPSGTHGTNRFTVFTGVDLDSCLMPKFGHVTEGKPAEPNQCSNNNYVIPRLGVFAVSLKAAAGDQPEDPAEKLVDGALDIRKVNGEYVDCTSPNIPHLSAGYTRNPCASYTVPGTTDSWTLQNVNTGSEALAKMVIVDLMPRPGDRNLGGQDRESTFKPVLALSDLESNFDFKDLPANASYEIEVSTGNDVCVGPAGSTGVWANNPTCDATAQSQWNEWELASAFSGDIADITAIRFTLDMSAEPLQPGKRIAINFKTVNMVKPVAAAGAEPTQQLTPELARFQTQQFAWNQSGIIAWDATGKRMANPTSLVRAGVAVKTADLNILKKVEGPGANYAPEEFDVNLACTIPDGTAGGGRVSLDMGAFETVTLAKRKNSDDEWEIGATVPNIPIGADCTASEAGPVGEYGESGRAVEGSDPGVTPADDGLSAEIKIREENGDRTELTFTNVYTVAGVAVQKMTTSNNSHPVPDAKKNADYGFELNCEVNGYDQPIVRNFAVKGGALRTQSDIPEGARCTVTETNDRGALGTTVTVNGQKIDGTASEEFVVPEDGVTVLFSNKFEGVAKPLPNTGWSGTMPLAAMAALLLLGAAAIALEVRNRKRKQS